MKRPPLRVPAAVRSGVPSKGDLVRLRETVLRSVSLVVTDRRWAAPLSAMALGFGLFLGVAIGPGADGSLATGASRILAVASPAPEQAPVARAEPESESTSHEPEPFEAEPEPEPLEAETFEPELVPEALPEEAPAEDAPPPEEAPQEEAPQGEESEAQELKGAVVHANPAAQSYTLAIAGGELVSVHAEKLPPPGTRLAVEAEPLENNTFAEVERERAGAATKASLRGVVTYVDADPAAPAYTVSGRGSSILVRVPPAPAPALPELGAYATVGVAIEAATPEAPAPEAPAVPEPVPEPAPTCVPDPGLKPAPEPTHVVVQRTLETEAEPATYVDIAAIVSAVCRETGQLLLSADDVRAGEADLLLTVPASIDTAKLKTGDSVVATATVEEGGALVLAGLASDEGLNGAESAATAQGDLRR